jgi:hypothetical protein
MRECKTPYIYVKCAIIAEWCKRKDEHFNIPQPPGKYIDLFIYTLVADCSKLSEIAPLSPIAKYCTCRK